MVGQAYWSRRAFSPSSTAALPRLAFDGLNYNFAFAGGGPSGLSLAAQTYNGWFIGTGFEYAFTWLPINGLFLKTEVRYSQCGGNFGVSVPGCFFFFFFTEFISTELVYRFNWFGR